MITESKIRVVFTVTNCICFDQRVIKMADVLRNMGCEILVTGRRKGNCCRISSLPFRTMRFRMIFNKGFLFYAFFNIRLFFYLAARKFDVIVANDLDTLLPAFIISKIKKCTLVFDSHEYFTGVPELNGREFVRSVWKKIERSIVPGLRYVITVSDSVATQYEKEYGIRPSVIRNCARSSEEIIPHARQQIGINMDDLLLIIQGGGINMDKGTEELMDAIALTDGVSLLIAGDGDVVPGLKKKAAVMNLTDRIKFIPRLPWDEMMKYTRMADAGMSLEKDTNLNYRFSLPNKLLDYLSAGIAVICGDLPEMRNVVKGNNCGIIIPEITPVEIKGAIEKLKSDPHLLTRLKQNSAKAYLSLNWELESQKVIEFYKAVLSDLFE